jgi:hypothetical protein
LRNIGRDCPWRALQRQTEELSKEISSVSTIATRTADAVAEQKVEQRKEFTLEQVRAVQDEVEKKLKS